LIAKQFLYAIDGRLMLGHGFGKPRLLSGLGNTSVIGRPHLTRNLALALGVLSAPLARASEHGVSCFVGAGASFRAFGGEHGLGLEPYRLQIGHRLLKLRRNFRAFLDQPFVLSNILATSHGSLVVLRLEIFHVNVFHGNRFGGYYFTSSDSGRLSRYEFGGWRGGCLHHGFAMASTGPRSGVTEKL